MKKVHFFLLCISILFISGCKKAEPKPKYEQYEFYSDNCFFMEGGTSAGQCGWYITARKSNGDFVRIKPMVIPDGMVANANYTYEARIEVFAIAYECYNGMHDPIPGRKREKSVYQYGNILEFKRIR